MSRNNGRCRLSGAGATHVQKVVHASHDRFLKLPIFNVANFVSPRRYSSDDSDQITNIEWWLERILLKFPYIVEEGDIHV